jgi:hypothetical protein
VGEAAGSEGTNQKGRRIFHEDATDARAGWAGRDGFGLRGRRGQWAGWAERPDGPQGQPGRNQKRISELKIGFFFEFIKDLEICRRRFRRNFDMRIFPKFFYALKDFRKI